MKIHSGPSTRSIAVLAQDPTVKDHDGLPLFTTLTIPYERLSAGPKGARFHIVDYDATLNKYISPAAGSNHIDLADTALSTPKKEGRQNFIKQLLSNPHFHAQNVYGIAASTLFEFEKALGRRVSWGFESKSHQLKIAPHAFTDMNAFYSRRDEALTFGYFPKSRRSSEFVFTCLSFDIVTHETTHAILDGLRTEYVHASSIDQGAFHEGFSDIIALLSAFKNEGVISVGLSRKKDKTIETKLFEPKRLRKSFLFGLAQQFGSAIAEESMIKMRGDALRRSVDIEPGHDHYHDPKYRKSFHEFGEILVAAVLNTFISIWCRRVAPLDPVRAGRVDRNRAVEEGAKAAKHLITMCIRALDYLPPTNVTFPDYAMAIITADFETAPDDSLYGYRQVLCDTFASYGILPKRKSAESCRWDGPEDGAQEIIYGFDGHAEMQWDRESMFRFLWENEKPLGLNPTAFTKIISVRPVVRKGPNGNNVKETVAEYIQQMNVLSSELKNLKIDRPEGMSTNEYIRLRGGGTLIFDDYGCLKYHISNDVIGSKQSDRLESLWENGYFHKEEREVRRFAQVHQDRSMGRSKIRSKEQW